jgi:hypothetical protein
MQRLEVSGAVRPIYGTLGVKRLIECQRPTHVVTIIIPFISLFLVLGRRFACVSLPPFVGC